MKKYRIQVKMEDDTIGDQLLCVIITVYSAGTSLEDVTKALELADNSIWKDGLDVYANNGYSPQTLLDYTCRQHGWGWEPMVFDGEVSVTSW